MSRDTLFTADNSGDSPFEFTESVAEVFPDMLKRSIPGYAATIQAIGSLASRYVQENSRCYDLGCSLGAASAAILRNVAVDGVRLVAVDNAAAMASRCQKNLGKLDAAKASYSVLQADIQEVDIVRASMVVLNYTLQFLPLADRADMIARIANGMNEGGVLVLSEKVVDEDPTLEALLVELHHDFKRRNSYSDMEIARKRAALENVLVPETVADHIARLREAGFRHCGVWLRYLNFVSLIAIR